MTQTPLEAQLEAIVGAAVVKAVAKTTERLTAEFKAKNEGLLDNRNDLLAENRRLKGKPDGERSSGPTGCPTPPIPISPVTSPICWRNQSCRG
jgi:hypothetical protein